MGTIIDSETALLQRQCAIKSCHNPSLWTFSYDCTNEEYVMKETIHCLKKARIICWGMEMWNAAIRGADEAFKECKISFESMAIDAWPIEKFFVGQQLWLYAGVTGSAWSFLHGERWPLMRLNAVLNAFADINGVKKMRSVLFFDDRGEDYLKGFKIFAFPPIHEGHDSGFYCNVLAGLNFLGLKLTALETKQIHSKKKLKRLTKEYGALPDIRTVVLRLRESSHSDNARHVDWQHKWIVSGHWRKQWFPSRQENRPIYIEPYIKGPDDKPLLEQRETIYKAIR